MNIIQPVTADDLKRRDRANRIAAEKANEIGSDENPRIHLTIRQGEALAMLLWELFYSLPESDRTKELGATVNRYSTMVHHPLETDVLISAGSDNAH
jgi:hypothetical protein